MPEELLLLVLSYLDKKTLISLQEVSVGINRLSKDRYLWNNFQLGRKNYVNYESLNRKNKSFFKNNNIDRIIDRIVMWNKWEKDAEETEKKEKKLDKELQKRGIFRSPRIPYVDRDRINLNMFYIDILKLFNIEVKEKELADPFSASDATTASYVCSKFNSFATHQQ
jgi:F-box-like